MQCNWQINCCKWHGERLDRRTAPNQNIVKLQADGYSISVLHFNFFHNGYWLLEILFTPNSMATPFFVCKQFVDLYWMSMEKICESKVIICLFFIQSNLLSDEHTDGSRTHYVRSFIFKVNCIVVQRIQVVWVILPNRRAWHRRGYYHLKM